MVELAETPSEERSTVEPEKRPAPDWAGDVSVGVDAWTRRASSTGAAGTSGAPARDDTAPTRARRGAGRGSGARSGRRSGGSPRSRRSDQDGPPPPDRAALGPEADPESVARKILLDQLTGQARSRRQLADKLAAKEVPDDVATRLLDRFEEVGLVDDGAFARSWIASRGPRPDGGGRGLARRALAHELRGKGIDDETAREALDDVDPDEEEQTARRLVRAKLRSLSRVDEQTATRRLVGMLARKGYGAGLAFSVVRDELAAAGREADDSAHEPPE